jgi:hypothetical protein
MADQIRTTCLAAQTPIPESVHEIISDKPYGSFGRADWPGNVPSILIPDSTLLIDSEAFSNCSHLIRLYFTEKSQL